MSASNHPNSSEIVHSGWLTKSPPAKGIFRPRWRRRWFILKPGSLPDQFLFEYFTDESCRRQKGIINLDECLEISAPFVLQERNKYTFTIKTLNRTYYFAAESEMEMKKWVESLCQICGLKNVDDDQDNTRRCYSKASDENNKPTEVEVESGENSPTLSSHVSGPYIPISECFTGKPILFNDKPMGNEAMYMNSMFPFPPKVNWATHPGKREIGETDSPGRQTRTAPPRPPKKVVPRHSPQSSGEGLKGCEGLLKNTPPPSASHIVFRYDNFDDVHSSSSTCSSLHSPPGSAGVLYSNLGDVGPEVPAPTPAIPSPDDSLVSAQRPTSPPKVDRKLKPDLLRKEPSILPRFPVIAHTRSHSSGSMTLPSRVGGLLTSACVGPAIDRSVKPGDHASNLKLGPTPVQLKNNSSRGRVMGKSSTSTLPSRRREGPVVSPQDKFFEEELQGTYLKIECGSGVAKPTPKIHKRTDSGIDDGGGVEYRLIDHNKTKALNQMRQEREQQLRATVNKNLH